MTETASSTISLGQQLERLREQYKTHMSDSNQNQLLEIMQNIENFLERNKASIMEICAMNGYSNQSPDWTQHYASFLKGTIAAIKYDQNPSHQPFDTNLIFENLTQLHYLMITPNK